MMPFIRDRRLLLSFALLALMSRVVACGSDDHAAPSAVLDAGAAVDGSVINSPDAADTPAPIDAFDVTFCTRSSGCYVFPSDCCQTDCAAVTPVPMNGIGRRGYFQSCLDHGCQACVVGPELVPRCIDSRCDMVALGSSSLSACNVDQDCELRWGSLCCELCHPNVDVDLVAATRTAAFCAPDDQCDRCGLAPIPAGASAVCVDGHCKVQR